MNIIDKKPRETPENIFYGVNVNDKAAVEKEFRRLQSQHRKVTIVVIIVLIVLGIIGFDFYRVNFMGGKPIFAIEQTVENGTLFKGLGYRVLYCENGERYAGAVLYKTCDEVDEITFTNIVYEKLIEYARDNKIVDMNNLDHLTINSLEEDETNEEGGHDYFLDVSFACKNEKSNCFKTNKEFYDPLNIKFYVKINKYNEIYEIANFKNSGKHYDDLVADYSEKLKTYLIENDKLVEDNLSYFKMKLTDNYGRFKFRGTVYVESYLIEINYACVADNDNTCVSAFDKKDIDGDFANLSFYASMFIDEENNISLVGPREYLTVN